MVIAADYPFLDVVLTMVIFFTWVVWIWMMILVLSDVFRRRDISGWSKAAWIVFLIILPFIGVLAYLIAQHDAMTERRSGDLRDAEAQMNGYLRSVAADQGPAAEIEKAAQLLERGAISQTEFETIRAKALA
jgi:general stress protein CsbA